MLAHQGGWDEALFVIGPLIFIVLLLRMAKRRADRASDDRNAGEHRAARGDRNAGDDLPVD